MLHNIPHRPSREDKKSTQVRKAIGVLIFLSLVAAGIGYAYYIASANIRPIDPTTFCPTDAKGPSSETVILLDRTDPFTLTQQAALLDHLNEVKDNTPKYGLIKVYTVEPTEEKLLRPVFSACNPGRGDDVSSWTGNPHLLEERWKDTFDAPLQHLFSTILVTDTAAISPIMESIQSIAVTDLGSEKVKEKKIPRRLIVISDLIQYMKNYSQYKHYGSFDEFRSLPYYQSVRADLSGISVEVWYVRRKKTLAIQNDNHLEFWRNYFLDQGGNLAPVWYVPGT